MLRLRICILHLHFVCTQKRFHIKVPQKFRIKTQKQRWRDTRQRTRTPTPLPHQGRRRYRYRPPQAGTPGQTPSCWRNRPRNCQEKHGSGKFHCNQTMKKQIPKNNPAPTPTPNARAGRNGSLSSGKQRFPLLHGEITDHHLLQSTHKPCHLRPRRNFF